MLLQIPGMMRIEVNMDYTETMGEKIPFVTRLKDMLSGKLGSLYDFNQDVMGMTPKEYRKRYRLTNVA